MPVAVVAFTEEALDTWGISDASEVVLYTPGLTSVQQGGSNRNFYLRGVGTFDFHLTAASSVGQYYDGVTLTSGFHARAALFDMERVEVLKGPQNTLFGLNTTGGAVNYISKQPEIGKGTQGSAEVKAGSDGLFGLDATVGFDNLSNLAARLAVHTNSYDGPFVSNQNGVDFGGDDLTAYRGTLLWKPSERINFKANLHSSSNSNNGPAVRGVGSRAADGMGLCEGFVSHIIDFGQMTDCFGRSNPDIGQAAANPSTSDWKTVTQTLGFEDVSTNGYYVKVDYAFDFATLDASLAFDSLDVQTAIDSDGGPNVLLSVQQEEARDTLQYEVRLTSNDTSSAFRWIAGLFILNDESEAYTGVTAPGLGGRPGNGDNIPNVQLDFTKDNTGLYGQLEYDFNDDLTLTAGLRSSDEEFSGRYLPSSPVVTAELLEQPIFSDTVARLVREQFVGRDGYDANGYEIARQVSRTLTNNDVGYTFKLDWKASENSLVYGSVSKGFKGGALDIRAVYALLPARNLTDSPEQLDPESLDAIEIGYKTSFLQDKIRLDISYFDYQYHDLQQFVTVAGFPSLENAPESVLSGIDGSLRYANDSGFYLDFGFSTIDAEITETGDSNFALGPLGNAPPLSLSLLASQEFVLGNNLLAVTGGLSHVDEHPRGSAISANSAVTDFLIEPAYTLINAHVAYRFGPDHKYKVSFAGLNLTDENFCGARLVNDAGRLIADMFTRRAFHYHVLCRTNRAATQTFELGFGLNF